MRICRDVKGHMAKKNKLGTHADALTPEERASQNKKANAERAFGGDGNKKGRDVELSENTGQAPHERAASRGAKGVPKKQVPSKSWYQLKFSLAWCCTRCADR